MPFKCTILAADLQSARCVSPSDRGLKNSPLRMPGCATGCDPPIAAARRWGAAGAWGPAADSSRESFPLRLSIEQRRSVHERFMHDELTCVCATVAFGMSLFCYPCFKLGLFLRLYFRQCLIQKPWVPAIDTIINYVLDNCILELTS